MQLITFLSAAATVATVSADKSEPHARPNAIELDKSEPHARPNAIELDKSCDFSEPHIRIINRCDYKVNLWSVFKSTGCPTDGMVTLEQGQVYSENLWVANTTDGTGISIKLSKTESCKGNEIAQVEYFLDERPDTKKDYQYNYYDMSYVDCPSENGDCPTRQEGYYWSAGDSAIRAMKVAADNSWCPTLRCNDPVSCGAISYVLWDDTRTKSCGLKASMELYLCGSEPPSADDDKPAYSAPAKPSKQPEPKPEPTPTPEPKEPSPVNMKVDIAAVTNAPEIKDEIKAPPKVKTEIVYVTAYEYVNAKRHEHARAHARRHQQFHA